MSDTPETPENEDEKPERPAYDGPTVSISDEMKSSYLDYAMSVIVSRAIPDLRDGLNLCIGAFFMRCMKPTTAMTSLIGSPRGLWAT